MIPTPIGNLGDFTLRAHHILKQLNYVACEDTRTSAPILKKINPHLHLFAAHEHNENQASEKIIALLKQNESVGLVSDAGTPAISDPGAKIVCKVQQAGFAIVPLPGACAAIAAFSASGFLAKHFYFYGFLPSKKNGRIQVLNDLKNQNGALIFYESPHRIKETLNDLANIFPQRELFVARELTKCFEELTTLLCHDAPKWFNENPNRQKGEFVLILNEGKIKNPFENKAEELLKCLLEHNLSVKDSAKITEKITGIHKKILYEKALLLKKE